MNKQNELLRTLRNTTDLRVIDYLNNITLKGDSVKKLLSDISNITNSSILIQTNDIVVKYGDIFYAFGNIPTVATYNNVINSHPTIPANKTLLTSLQFETNYNKCDIDFNDNTTIFYIRDRNNYHLEIKQVGTVLCIKVKEIIETK